MVLGGGARALSRLGWLTGRLLSVSGFKGYMNAIGLIEFGERLSTWCPPTGTWSTLGLDMDDRCPLGYTPSEVEDPPL